MLEKEFKYYLDHQKDLIEKYKGRYVVIRNDEVIGDYLQNPKRMKNPKKNTKLALS